MRATVFVLTLVAGLVPAFYPAPADGSPLFVLFVGTRQFTNVWEPPGRDRITLLRAEAERYGSRRPCMWWHLADLDRIVGNEAQANRDEAKTIGTVTRDKCPRRLF